MATEAILHYASLVNGATSGVQFAKDVFLAGGLGVFSGMTGSFASIVSVRLLSSLFIELPCSWSIPLLAISSIVAGGFAGHGSAYLFNKTTQLLSA